MEQDGFLITCFEGWDTWKAQHGAPVGCLLFSRNSLLPHYYEDKGASRLPCNRAMDLNLEFLWGQIPRLLSQDCTLPAHRDYSTEHSFLGNKHTQQFQASFHSYSYHMLSCLTGEETEPQRLQCTLDLS